MVSNIFYFHPYLGKWFPIWWWYFWSGWFNHHLDSGFSGFHFHIIPKTSIYHQEEASKTAPWTSRLDNLFSVFHGIGSLGGGFKYFLFSSLFGEDSQFDDHIFQMGWFNHRLGEFVVDSFYCKLSNHFPFCVLKVFFFHGTVFLARCCFFFGRGGYAWFFESQAKIINSWFVCLLVCFLTSLLNIYPLVKDTGYCHHRWVVAWSLFSDAKMLKKTTSFPRQRNMTTLCNWVFP